VGAEWPKGRVKNSLREAIIPAARFLIKVETSREDKSVSCGEIGILLIRNTYIEIAMSAQKAY